jgi:amino acid permease
MALFRKGFGITSNLGMTALAIFLVLVGLSYLQILSISGMNSILGILAIAAGVLLFLGR